jgi:hypothetical protein
MSAGKSVAINTRLTDMELETILLQYCRLRLNDLFNALTLCLTIGAAICLTSGFSYAAPSWQETENYIADKSQSCGSGLNQMTARQVQINGNTLVLTFEGVHSNDPRAATHVRQIGKRSN